MVYHCFDYTSCRLKRCPADKIETNVQNTSEILGGGRHLTCHPLSHNAGKVVYISAPEHQIRGNHRVY